MSDGELHDRITRRLIPLGGIFGLVIGQMLGINWILGFFLGCLGTWLTLYRNPDLDQVGITNSEMAVARIKGVGLILGPLFIAWWFPYALIFGTRLQGFNGRHRSILTHGIIIGTAIRWAYSFALIVAILVLVALVARVGIPRLPYELWPYLFVIFTGNVIGDAGHWCRDELGWEW